MTPAQEQKTTRCFSDRPNIFTSGAGFHRSFGQTPPVIEGNYLLIVASVHGGYHIAIDTLSASRRFILLPLSIHLVFIVSKRHRYFRDCHSISFSRTNVPQLHPEHIKLRPRLRQRLVIKRRTRIAHPFRHPIIKPETVLPIPSPNT